MFSISELEMRFWLDEIDRLKKELKNAIEMYKGADVRKKVDMNMYNLLACNKYKEAKDARQN